MITSKPKFIVTSGKVGPAKARAPRAPPHGMVKEFICVKTIVYVSFWRIGGTPYIESARIARAQLDAISLKMMRHQEISMVRLARISGFSAARPNCRNGVAR
jgi:hypothetical protein